jgi:ligand-binding SRPBCC domain-containing protein
MPTLRLSTYVDAPIRRVFDLARSIDAHVASTGGTGERAIAGVTKGLIGLGQSVTWEANHFGVCQRLTVRIIEMTEPISFEDEMVSGAFKCMHHRHEFVSKGEGTEMIDVFTFAAPLGILGRIAESLFLKAYMRRFLVSRAHILKRIAESDEWQQYGIGA